MTEITGEGVLETAFNQLHKSNAVNSAVDRARARGDRFEDSKVNRINRYLNRLGEIDNKAEPRRTDLLEAFKRILYRDVIIKPENFPRSYFTLQQRIARERGLGNIEITDEMRRQWVETVIADQEKSFDAWIDYLASNDAPYPMWFKYYTVASVAQLSLYDKERKEFKKRDKTTTTIFPDINREALAYVYDSLVKVHITKEGVSNEDLRKLVGKARFAPLYAYAIEKVTPATHEQREMVEGEWVKYPGGSDHKSLCASLQGHGTGWCTAGEETARAHLSAGDFYVYYTKDDEGKNTIPRIAIRMENGSVAEVRGVDPHQELETALIDTAREKYLQLPGGEKFERKGRDMKRLTEIERMMEEKKELSLNDLIFLWEVDSRIEGFGFSSDPRIRELQKKRDRVKDFVEIHGCKPKELALFAGQLGRKKPYYAGRMYDLARAIGKGRISGEGLSRAWNVIESKGGDQVADELANEIREGKLAMEYLPRALTFIESNGDEKSAYNLAVAIERNKLTGENLNRALTFIERKSSDQIAYPLATAICEGVLTGDALERAWIIIETKGREWVVAPLAYGIEEGRLTGENLVRARRVVDKIFQELP